MPEEANTPSVFVSFIKKLFSREVLSYLLFGVLTTGVNLAVYFAARLVMNWSLANAIAWVIAVEFAFLTNRSIVFRVRKNPIRQRLQFYVARLSTLGLEYVTLLGFHVLAGLDDRYAKLIAGVFVVIGNYVLSKWIVFRPAPEKEPPTERT